MVLISWDLMFLLWSLQYEAILAASRGKVSDIIISKTCPCKVQRFFAAVKDLIFFLIF